MTLIIHLCFRIHTDYFISMAYQQICTLAALLRPSPIMQAPTLSRPMLRKLLAFVNSNLEEPFGLHKVDKELFNRVV